MMEVDSDWEETESDYGFKMLFSPDSASYLPIEDQLKQYKTRDLEKSKMYLMAAKLWGLGQRSRRRIIIAPPMTDKPRQSKITTQTNVSLNPPAQSAKPRVSKSDDWALSKIEQERAHEEDLADRTVEYKHWLAERMKLRDGLENLGLSDSWLRKKNDLTPLEQRVCNKMEEDKRAKEEARLRRLLPPTPPSRRKQEKRKPVYHWQSPLHTNKGKAGVPDISKPIPEGLTIIVKYLARHRQRMLDLFARADKDKNWNISRKEFKNCLKEAGILITDDLMHELIESLDSDGNDNIDYRELAAGVKDYKVLERAKGRSRGSRRSHVTVSIPSPVNSRSAAQREAISAMPPLSKSPLPTVAVDPPRSSSVTSDRSINSSPSNSTTSSQLPLPRSDVVERVVLQPDDLVEKRKKEKYLTAHRSKGSRKKRHDKIKTGNSAIDKHSLRSTLEGDVGPAVNRYREARLKEYHEICQLCEKNGTFLTPELLQKALLHPGDKPHRRIRNHIRQPGTQTISSHFADPPEPPKSPNEYRDPDKIVVTSNGELVMEAKHAYPLRQDTMAEPELMNLSSGKAFVRRKVDCWMTFEDYDRLTSHLGKRYVSATDGGVDPNAFWPGQLLDKMRLCMPDGRLSPSECLFSTTKQQRPVNEGYTDNNLKWWPVGAVNDQCYIKPADIEQRKIYSIDWK